MYVDDPATRGVFKRRNYKRLLGEMDSTPSEDSPKDQLEDADESWADLFLYWIEYNLQPGAGK